MKLKKALLVAMLAVVFSTHADAGWFDKKNNNPPTQEVTTKVVTTNDLGLTALDSEPNMLHGIDGLHQGRVPLGAVSPNTLKTFVSVVDLVRRDYVKDVNDEKLFEYAMSGMLTKLDRNAGFLDQTAYANLKSFTEGNIANVGLTASWQEAEAHWVVTSVGSQSPAKKAGIDVGDYLHQIGDIKLGVGQSENDITQLLSGIAGTQVDVVFSKAGRSKRTVSIQRTEMIKASIETMIYDGVAIIKLPVFQDNTRQQILDSLAQSSTPISGVILDVRNNPGGVLESARDVVSLFVRGQQVVQVMGRNGLERVISTEGSPLLAELPVMVLQNRYSASASEVLASSLQAQNKALIVGERSYGKGSVQSVIPIGDSSQAVKLTTAHYLTANGDVIDGVGVVPDVAFDIQERVVPTEVIQDTWLKQALTIMEQKKLPKGIKFDPVGGF
ncbi:S41 family peptidase [Moraxella oblonga]|uniref:S41 family peptidase n=1 Tax=Moraxella oblonga TaxID=200413 RepID=UPI00082C796B|nr:S41 family peptidase [Moraxella oblonga]